MKNTLKRYDKNQKIGIRMNDYRFLLDSYLIWVILEKKYIIIRSYNLIIYYGKNQEN